MPPEDLKTNKQTLISEPAGNDSNSLKSGKFVFANGDVYEGSYELMNQSESIYRQGYGVFTCKNGITYSGNWKLDKLNGKGIYTHPQGMRYEGDFIDGKFDGIGTYTWQDGSVYEGEFKGSKLDGQGVFRDINGQVWIGKFRGNIAPELRFKLNM